MSCSSVINIILAPHERNLKRLGYNSSDCIQVIVRAPLFEAL